MIFYFKTLKYHPALSSFSTSSSDSDLSSCVRLLCRLTGDEIEGDRRQTGRGVEARGEDLKHL